MSVAEVRARVSACLGSRRTEVEEAILNHVWAVSSSAGAGDRDYASALQNAVSAGVGHGLAGVERGAERVGPIPAALFTEARQAARSGVALDVELRRYFAGYALFCDYVIQTAEEDVPLRGPVLRQTFRSLAEVFERLVVAVVGEYMREKGSRSPRPPQAQIERVKKLLAGETADGGGLAYELDDWHVGAVARGGDAVAAIRGLAQGTGCRLLLTRPDRETIWAWFGARRRVAVSDLPGGAPSRRTGDGLVAFGEPARGIAGWRLTHRQAAAALEIAQAGVDSVVRYADVGLLASISQDDLLATSLRQIYLAPLADGRDGGVGLRETLRAYFATGRNISSAASALGVSRQTVGNRLRAVEEKLERTIESCAPEIEVALRLEGVADDTAVADSEAPPPVHRKHPNLSIRSANA